MARPRLDPGALRRSVTGMLATRGLKPACCSYRSVRGLGVVAGGVEDLLVAVPRIGAESPLEELYVVARDLEVGVADVVEVDVVALEAYSEAIRSVPGGGCPSRGREP